MRGFLLAIGGSLVFAIASLVNNNFCAIKLMQPTTVPICSANSTDSTDAQ